MFLLFIGVMGFLRGDLSIASLVTNFLDRSVAALSSLLAGLRQVSPLLFCSFSRSLTACFLCSFPGNFMSAASVCDWDVCGVGDWVGGVCWILNSLGFGCCWFVGWSIGFSIFLPFLLAKKVVLCCWVLDLFFLVFFLVFVRFRTIYLLESIFLKKWISKK